MNLIVIATAYLLANRLLKISGLVDFLISVFILYLSEIVAVELFLGIFNILNLTNVLFAIFLIYLLVWLALRKKASSLEIGDMNNAVSEILNNRVLLLIASIIIIFGSVKAVINLVNPPFGWDSLNYHFTFAVEWLKHGNLDTPITVFDDPSPSYYPINGSLFFLWLMFPLKNVFLADLGQVPFFILALLALYNISKKIGLNKEYSFYAASLFMLMPNFFKQLQIAYVDVMVAGLFLAGANYLFILNESFTLPNVLIYSLSIGLLIGTKTIALPYSAVLFLPFLYLCFRNIRKSYLFILSVVIIAAFGGFSYIRNFVETGNPLYPLDFKILGHSIFKGVMDTAVYGAHFRIQDYRLSKLLFHEGLGIQTLLFVLPGIFLGLPAAIIKRKKALGLNLTYFLLTPIFIYLIYSYVIPLANTRYLYSLLGIGIVVGFYAFDSLNIPKKVVKILVILCALGSMFELAKRQELIVSTVLTFFLFLALLFFGKIIKRGLLFLSRLVYILLIAVIMAGALFMLQQDYSKNEFPRYIKMVKYSGFWPDATRAWKWLNTETCGNNIAYAGRPVPFPLYGSNFKNNVYYVSVNKVDPAKLHYFPNSRYRWGYDFLTLHKNLEEKGNYRSDADYSAWLNNLRKRNTDYLFVYSLHQTEEIAFPIEDKWVSDRSDKFLPVFANRTIHIYKILK